MKSDVRDLVLKVRAGDEDAFAVLCEKYNALILSSSERYFAMMSNDGDISAEDFRQEASLAFYRAVNTYDVKQKAVTFGLYAKTCIRNALVSLLRKNAKKPRLKETDVSRDQQRDPLSGLVSDEDFGEIKAKLADIFSPYEYKVFLMFAQGKTPAQIGAELGTDAKSASNALFRAREKLKASFRIGDS